MCFLADQKAISIKSYANKMGGAQEKSRAAIKNLPEGAVNWGHPHKYRPPKAKKPAICGLFIQFAKALANLVGLSRLELLTPTMSRWCSNQLSYSPVSEARTLPVASDSGKRG